MQPFDPSTTPACILKTTKLQLNLVQICIQLQQECMQLFVKQHVVGGPTSFNKKIISSSVNR